MKMLMTAAAAAAVLVSTGAAMAAQVVVPGPTATMTPLHRNQNQRNQFQSNQNLRVARRHIETAIDELHRDPADYGGHKEKAVDDLGVARQYLDQGLAFQRNHGRVNGTPVPTTGGMVPRPVNAGDNENGEAPGSNDNAENGENGGGDRILGQRAANENIADVRSHVEAAIDALSRDTWDYGGFKERAMDKLQAARQELEAALDFVHNPGVRNGGSGRGVSDSNLRFVDSHVGLAIERLDADRNDYGGHRVAAINDLQTARTYLSEALSYDTSHDNGQGSVVNPTGVVNPNGTVRSAIPNGTIAPNGTISQKNSNDSLMDARTNIETAIDALQRDGHDYGGFRMKAIGALEAARNELLQALDFRRTH